MTWREALKVAIALAILAMVVFAMFRKGRGIWWGLPKKTRVIFAVIVTVAITAAGFAYKSQLP